MLFLIGYYYFEKVPSVLQPTILSILLTFYSYFNTPKNFAFSSFSFRVLFFYFPSFSKESRFFNTLLFYLTEI